MVVLGSSIDALAVAVALVAGGIGATMDFTRALTWNSGIDSSKQECNTGTS